VLDAVELVDVDLLLEPGDCLVMYTDGVTEARRGKELFGEDRLRALVSGLDGSAGSVAARIEAEVVDFSEGHQLDDTAILVIRVPPAG
jgi:serine phosphatase RsbU (regulator of sigma subunit)